MASGSRIEREKITLKHMFKIYCKGNGHSPKLCADCSELLAYSLRRLDSCPHGNKKGSCKSCKTHCYKEPERTTIRKVMGYAGPRMMLRHPAMVIGHIRDGKWRR